MDDVVVAAIARWPDVPHVYGWLALDRRGQWRLQDSPIGNAHINEFIARNYEADERGAWFFQNGPQRVYVKLEYAPWILRVSGDTLLTHTGREAQHLREAFLDESGNLLLSFDAGVGLIDDRDLGRLLDDIRGTSGNAVAEAEIEQLMQGSLPPLTLCWHRARLPLSTIRRDEVAQRFGFVADPQPPS